MLRPDTGTDTNASAVARSQGRRPHTSTPNALATSDSL
jgi:hypothetical protein